MLATSQVGARFLAALAERLEDARARGDGLACHNLAMVAVHAFLAGLAGAPVLYSLLAHLTALHPSRYGALVDDVPLVGLRGVHPVDLHPLLGGGRLPRPPR